MLYKLQRSIEYFVAFALDCHQLQEFSKNIGTTLIHPYSKSADYIDSIWLAGKIFSEAGENFIQTIFRKPKKQLLESLGFFVKKKNETLFRQKEFKTPRKKM